MNVPHYEEDQLAASSVILADQLERVPTNSIGNGQFVIRSSKVRPRINDVFKQNETMGIYTDFTTSAMDEKTKRPQGTVEYEIVNNADNKTVIHLYGRFDRHQGFPECICLFSDGGEEIPAEIATAREVHVEVEGGRQAKEPDADTFGAIHGDYVVSIRLRISSVGLVEFGVTS